MVLDTKCAWCVLGVSSVDILKQSCKVLKQISCCKTIWVFRSPKHKELFEKLEYIMDEEKEKTLKILIGLATSGYADNIEFGRAGLSKTFQEMKEVSDDKQLIRLALLNSPYAQDNDFEGVIDSLVLF